MSSDNSNHAHSESTYTSPPVGERVAFHTITRHAEKFSPSNFSDYSVVTKQLSTVQRHEDVVHMLPGPLSPYPDPDAQSPTTEEIMNEIYLCSNDRLTKEIEEGFDFIVIGSGFTCLGFVDQTLAINKDARILVLERGEFWLPDHFQNLSLPFKATLTAKAETFPFTLSEETWNDPSLHFVHGSSPFIGGRSNFWSAWCPEPSDKLMRSFPKKLIDTRNQPKFFKRAKKLINVATMNELGDPLYNELQRRLFKNLGPAVPDGSISHQANEENRESSEKDTSHNPILGAELVIHAPLAVNNADSLTSKYKKFSTVAPLLKLYQDHKEKLVVASKSIVTKLNADSSNKVTEIETTKRKIPVGKNTKIILAVGVFPAVTILKNSFPSTTPFQKNLGKRLSGHFLTHIVARCPKSHFNLQSDASEHLKIAAIYLAGHHPNNLQYHVQITGLNAPNGAKDAVDAGRECPDYAAAATEEQITGSEDYVVFVCASLGEFDETNPENWVRDNPQDPDITTNIKVQYVLHDREKDLWKMMDEATYATIETMCGYVDDIQYWKPLPLDGKPNNGKWINERPLQEDIRIPGIVHEACALWMGDSKDNSVVSPDYRPWGVENVYVTGAAIFASSGSWNPTLTMVGFAQDLADQLNNKLKSSHEN